jgi:hypothetical protein
MKCQGDSNTCQNKATAELEVRTKHGFVAIGKDETLLAGQQYESRFTKLCDKHAERLRNNVTILSEEPL